MIKRMRQRREVKRQLRQEAHAFAEASVRARLEVQAEVAQTRAAIERHRATPPTCPACGSVLEVKVSDKMWSVGRTFWGCSAYPRCQQPPLPLTAYPKAALKVIRA